MRGTTGLATRFGRLGRLERLRRLGGLALALTIGCGTGPAGFADLGADRLVDLTHPFDAETVYWPTEEGFVLERGPAGYTDEGYYYAANRLRGAEHGGTHLDAPIHFGEGRRTVDRIPLEQLIGRGVVIDVAQACRRDRDYAVRVEDFVAFEEEHGTLPAGAIVLLRTGFGRHWPDRSAYLGTDERGPGAVAKLSFPGLSPQAARWLVENRQIGAIGIDTASIDPGRSRRFESHQVLAAHEIPALENLANLDALPPSGFAVVALPQKIRDGSGAPLRAVAVLP